MTAISKVIILVSFGAALLNGVVLAGSCDRENHLMVQCLQNHFLICGMECVSALAMSPEISSPAHVDGNCSAVVQTWCSVSQCCPQCFGEIQQSLDCHFYGTDADHSDHETNTVTGTTGTDEALGNNSSMTSMTHSSCDTTCPCTDVPNWYDSGGEAFGCAWYAYKAEERCSAFGSVNMNNGFVGNTACCVCQKLVSSAAASPTTTTTTRLSLFVVHPREWWRNGPTMMLIISTLGMIMV